MNELWMLGGFAAYAVIMRFVVFPVMYRLGG